MRYFLITFSSLILIYIFIKGLSKDPKIIPSNLINETVPNFLLKPISSDIKFFERDLLFDNNHVKLVNVFASWCPPCKIEHPQINYLSKKKNLMVFGMNKKDKKEDLKSWLKELGNPYHAIGSDLSGRASIEWGVYGLPETFIVDKKSKIRFKHIGPILERDLIKITQIIEKLLDE